MIEMKDGQLYASRKYMGNLTRCLKNYVNDLAKEYPDYDQTRCFITHSCCEKEVVDMVRGMVENTFRFNEILETVAGGVVTGHCGKKHAGRSVHFRMIAPAHMPYPRHKIYVKKIFGGCKCSVHTAEQR